MKPVRIAFYGNFGSGNLGNECTLQAAIEHILRCRPDAQLQCICTVPEDVQTRHKIPAFRSEARASRWTWAALGAQENGRVPDIGQQSALPAASSGKSVASLAPESTRAEKTAGPRSLIGLLARISRAAFHRIPLELVHWVKSLQVVNRSDILIVAGTGIVTDEGCGPFGWPYDIFKFSVLATVCRVKIVFLSVGVGQPIHHPLSRWFIKRGLGLAHYRSYRDEESKQYMGRIGFNTDLDAVYPDLAFGLCPRQLTSDAPGLERRPVVGLGLKDYAGARVGTKSYQDYLDTMVSFVLWLQEHNYGVRLIVGDVQYDTRVRQDVIDALKRRSVVAEQSLLLSEQALTVEQLLSQLGETDAVVSPRLHNLILALRLNKPVIALSDRPKVDSLLAGLGLTQYCVPLQSLNPDVLIGRFEQLQNDAERLKPYIRGKVEKYRAALDEQYASIFAGTGLPASPPLTAPPPSPPR